MKRTILILAVSLLAFIGKTNAQKFVNPSGDTITITNLNTNPIGMGAPSFAGFDFVVKQKPKMVTNTYKGIIPFDNYQKNIDSLIQSTKDNPSYQQIIYYLFLDAYYKGKIKVDKGWRLIK